MIYFGSDRLKFPRHFNENPTKMVMTNEMTGEKVEFNVVDLSTNPHFYEFDFTGIDLKVGSYTYTMGKEVGLIQVGDYISTSTEYNERKNNIVYER